MIAIAIVGVLASVSMPIYTSYVATSSVSSCYKEISAGIVLFEIKTNNGTPPSAAANLAEINVNTASACKEHSLSFDEINGVVKGGATVSGSLITLKRDISSGLWSCRISNRPANWSDSYLPSGCLAL